MTPAGLGISTGATNPVTVGIVAEMTNDHSLWNFLIVGQFPHEDMGVSELTF